MFIRIFFCTTGVISSASGAYLLIASILRLVIDRQFPRSLTIGFTISFLLGMLLKGICWILLGVSNRFWKPNAGA